MSRARYKKRKDIFVLPDTFWCKYPSLDTVWFNTDRKMPDLPAGRIRHFSCLLAGISDFPMTET